MSFRTLTIFVEEGQDITPLTKIPTHIQMLIWGGAVDDYNPMHADDKIAEQAGYKEPIVSHGHMSATALSPGLKAQAPHETHR